MPFYQPSYIEAYKSGLLHARIDKAMARLEECVMCPRKCHVNRINGELGICKTAWKTKVASYAPHFGEETPLVGTHGSGTIFFTNCNLGCSFCQNSEISHEGFGVEISSAHLARIMINLQHLGCHNINLVTPSHVIPQILAALILAVKSGLTVPLVYNSSGYDDVSSLKLLDGIVDIYMPDFKFWNPEFALQFGDAKDYPEYTRHAIAEMHRQVGDLEIVNGKAVRGLLIRHLVLPNNVAGTKEIMAFISSKVSASASVNIMDQYKPCGDTFDSDLLGRSITLKEYSQAVDAAKKTGLTILN